MCASPGQNPVPIVESGRPVAELTWWSSDDSPVAPFAADEFQRYVREMSGASVPAERAARGGTAGADGPVASLLAVGPESAGDERRGALRDDWVAVAAERLADARPDSFAILTVDGAVVLAGTTHRGTLYAAYELLERFGVRFFAPEFEFYEGNAERVPERATLAVDPVDTVEEPGFGYRRKAVEEGRSHTGRTIREMVDWMAKAKQNVLTVPADYTNLEPGTVAWDEWREAVVPELEKRGLMLETGGHGFRAFLPPEEYEQAHPEWFVDGCSVFDVTEEDAVETYVDNVVDYLADRPEVDIFDAWPPDWATWPEAVVDEFGSGENAYAYLVGRLHDAVRERFPDRDVEIEALAYKHHFEVPDPEYAYPGDVLVDFAVIDRSYAEPIFEAASEQNAEYVALMEDWREAFDGTLGVHEYYRKYSWHSLPVVLPELVGRELADYDDFGFDGLWIYSEPADWLTYELTHRLVADMAWDADVDADAYVEAYCRDRYGPAAAAIRSYFEHVETAGRTLFDSFDGSFDDRDRVSAARDEYLQAADALADAAADAPEDSAAAFLVDRLETNVEFAVADTSISYYELRDESEDARRARERLRSLIEEHCFDGVVLRSEWALERCAPDEDFPGPTELIERYRDEWGA